MWVVALLVCACAGSGLARRSPNADLIEEYYMKGPEAGRYSNNILEDALLDVPGLIRKYGYPVEVHNVVTEDGYILEVQRIPHGRDANNFPDWRKPVVLVMHGLFSSAADWVLMGPGTALAYTLAEAGYDVWLGNARGTYYSRNHVSLDPDNDAAFWRFSWEQIGRFDLPAMIDYALVNTGRNRIHYIGHSQGTTAFWAMGSLRPDYNSKIISMQAYAPVAYLEHNQNPVFQALAPHANNIELIARALGINELLPNSELFTWAGQEFCGDGAVTQPVCSNVLFIIAGRSEDMHNATMFPVKLGHTPAGASVRVLVHYAQLIGQNLFTRYDHGPLSNLLEYGSLSPPVFPLNLITAPVFFHYVPDDVFAHLDDANRLYSELGRPLGKIRVPHDTFSHLDFMWGTEAKSLLYDRTIALMRAVADN